MSVRMRPRKPDETYDHWFDNTKLVAVNTCPTWGIVRYGLGKTTGKKANDRAMPLEAGAALHHVFAAVRIIDMIENGGEFYDNFNLDVLHGFARGCIGEGAWEKAAQYLAREGDFRTRAIATCMSVLETSGFEDDPSDKRRTLSNMEEAIIVYVDRYEWKRWMPIWRMQDGKPFIGIELPFDLVVEHTEELGEDQVANVMQLRGRAKRRFVGRIDALVFDREHEIVSVHENKTAGRLDRAWHEQWHTAHQPTGYTIAGETLLNGGVRVQDVTIFGLALPIPRSFDYGGCVRVPLKRSAQQQAEWFDWFAHTTEMFERFIGEPTRAPHYTHSCSRYFRPCPLIGFCASPPHERLESLDQMEVDVWNPLDESA